MRDFPENKKNNMCTWGRIIGEVVLITVIYLSGCVLSMRNGFFAFIWMFCCGIAIFLYFSISRKNLLDMRAILLGVLTLSIGISQLRLSAIQEVWQTQTWLCYLLGMNFFCLGYFIYERYVKKHVESKCFTLPQKWKRVSYGFNKKKIYYATIFLAVMPIILFCIQAAIKGFIPIFVRRYDAYTLFYTRMSIFINLVMLAAPLAFWCLKNMVLNKWQKAMMIAIIPLPTIIFQLMVQRGLFIWSLCILLVMVYFESKRKWFGVSMIILLLIFGVLFSSAMRSIPAEDMKTLWELNENIVIPQEPDNAPTVPDNNSEENSEITIKVPSSLYAPYYYVVNGLENFNYMIKDLDRHAYGLRQLSPFTVILRFPALKNLIAQYPSFTILANSTFCIIGDFYYDFGVIGVIVEMLLLGLISACIQFLYLKKKSPCGALVYGVFVSVFVTSFFAAWFSIFGTWLFLGGSFLVFLYSFFKISPSSKKQME